MGGHRRVLTKERRAQAGICVFEKNPEDSWLDCSPDCILKGGELVGRQVRRGGGERKGERRPGENVCRYTTSSWSSLPSGYRFTHPGHKDRKQTQCLTVACRKKASSGQEEGRTPNAKVSCFLLPAHLCPFSSPRGPAHKGSNSLQGSLGVLRPWLKTFGEGERNCHLSSLRTLSQVASSTRPDSSLRSLQEPLSLYL